MEQHKVRSYLLYAIGEVFLVVIGILIALQVNNWNEERKFWAKEVIYLQTLHEDMLANIAEIEDDIRQNKEVIVAIDSLLWMANTESYRKHSTKKLMQLIMAPGNYSKLQLEQSAIEEIIGAGILPNFRSPVIRRYIGGWEKSLIGIRELETFGRDLQEAYLKRLNDFMPFYAQEYRESILSSEVLDTYFNDLETLNHLSNIHFIARNLNMEYEAKILQISSFMGHIDQFLNTYKS